MMTATDETRQADGQAVGDGEPFIMKMMPGQEPYTECELQILFRLVADAADSDPGEESERACRKEVA